MRFAQGQKMGETKKLQCDTSVGVGNPCNSISILLKAMNEWCSPNS